MNTAILCYLIALGVGIAEVDAKVFTRCGLTQELLNLGFSRSLVGNWVCLIESESGRDTSKEIVKANGGKALGLFQINSKDWCKYGSPGGKCNMKCEDLINENIRDDAMCAKKVERETGFQGWQGWVRSCSRRTLALPSC
nr:lysozyme-like [Leptinotarsa decemlineata]